MRLTPPHLRGRIFFISFGGRIPNVISISVYSVYHDLIGAALSFPGWKGRAVTPRKRESVPYLAYFLTCLTFSLFLGETEGSLHPGKERACPSCAWLLSFPGWNWRFVTPRKRESVPNLCLTSLFSWVKLKIRYTQEKRERACNTLLIASLAWLHSFPGWNWRFVTPRKREIACTVDGRPQRDAKPPGPHLADWARQKKMLMYKMND